MSYAWNLYSFHLSIIPQYSREKQKSRVLQEMNRQMNREPRSKRKFKQQINQCQWILIQTGC